MTINRSTLYIITTPFGLLKEHHPKVAQALIESGGPWEIYLHRGWETCHSITLLDAFTYRLKRPEPPITDSEFIRAAVASGVNLHFIGKAVSFWVKGDYYYAQLLIGGRK